MINKIHNENCLETMKRMPDNFIKTCITSPPYWGLRDYGVDGQLGLEKTPEEYVKKMVDMFREVRRVLKKDGTLWLNLGDSYAGITGSQPNNGYGRKSREPMEGRKKKADGVKTKDLIGIPWMVAFALRSDGWYLRQDIIWSKPNPMPESVTDRCTKSHEYIFLLSKSHKYYYDHEAIMEESITKDNSIRDRDHTRLNNTPGRARMGGLIKNDYNYRNKRSVWVINTKPFSEAHFAVFPEELIEPCVLAGSSKGDIIYDPFMGSGTTAKVALRAGRNFIGSELNHKYCEIANKRIKPYIDQVDMFYR